MTPANPPAIPTTANPSAPVMVRLKIRAGAAGRAATVSAWRVQLVSRRCAADGETARTTRSSVKRIFMGRV